MTFAQRRNRLTTHFSERIPVVKRRISVCDVMYYDTRVCRRLGEKLCLHFQTDVLGTRREEEEEVAWKYGSPNVVVPLMFVKASVRHNSVLSFQLQSPLTNEISFMDEETNVKLQSTLTETGLCFTWGSSVAHHFAPR